MTRIILILFIISILISKQNCFSQINLKGKWLASYQETYSTYHFKKKYCIYKYYGLKGEPKITKYIYKLSNDSLYFFDSTTYLIEKIKILKKNSDDVIQFNETVLQRVYLFKKYKPIINKPQF